MRHTDCRREYLQPRINGGHRKAGQSAELHRSTSNNIHTVINIITVLIGLHLDLIFLQQLLNLLKLAPSLNDKTGTFPGFAPKCNVLFLCSCRGLTYIYMFVCVYNIKWLHRFSIQPSPQGLKDHQREQHTLQMYQCIPANVTLYLTFISSTSCYTCGRLSVLLQHLKNIYVNIPFLRCRKKKKSNTDKVTAVCGIRRLLPRWPGEIKRSALK